MAKFYGASEQGMTETIVFASGQMADIISRLVMGPDRGRTTQLVPESQTDLQAGTRTP